MSDGIELRGAVDGRKAEILTEDALEFVASLQREFGARRRELLAARAERQQRLDAGELPDFLESTRRVREDDSWRVAPPGPGAREGRRPVPRPRHPDEK